MPIQMVFHEGRDEIIAVVVSGAQAKLELDASALAGSLKKLGAQLFFKKTVGFALVDQERRHPSAVLNQSDRIMSAPGSLIRAWISTQRLLSPGDLGGCDDGRERGYGLEPARKTERTRERPVPRPEEGSVGKEGGQ